MKERFVPMTLKVFAYFITAPAFTFKAICQSRSCRDLVHDPKRNTKRNASVTDIWLHGRCMRVERNTKGRSKHDFIVETSPHDSFDRRNVPRRREPRKGTRFGCPKGAVPILRAFLALGFRHGILYLPISCRKAIL
jgi:hypothetical protein